MSESTKSKRLSKIAKEFNVGISTIIDFLHKKGIEIVNDPNAKISEDIFDILVKEYSNDIHVKKESEKINITSPRQKNESVTIEDIVEPLSVPEEEAEAEEELIIKNFSAGTYDDLKKEEKKPEV
jgi:translation initiation factor IF-2